MKIKILSVAAVAATLLVGAVGLSAPAEAKVHVYLGGGYGYGYGWGYPGPGPGWYGPGFYDPYWVRPRWRHGYRHCKKVRVWYHGRKGWRKKCHWHR